MENCVMAIALNLEVIIITVQSLPLKLHTRKERQLDNKTDHCVHNLFLITVYINVSHYLDCCLLLSVLTELL